MPISITSSPPRFPRQPAAVGNSSAPFQRSPHVSATLAELTKTVKESGLASLFMFVPANAQIDVTMFDYGSHKPMAGRVVRPPPPNANGERIVNATLCINASGHTGELEKFAKSNTYSYRIVLPDGQTIQKSGVPRTQPVEYATPVDIQFPLQKGQTVIEAWPDGTGPGGYIEGRRLEISY